MFCPIRLDKNSHVTGSIQSDSWKACSLSVSQFRVYIMAMTLSQMTSDSAESEIRKKQLSTFIEYQIYENKQLSVILFEF
jgi:hypothetical protein